MMETALHNCMNSYTWARTSTLAIVKLLIKRGANIHIRNNRGLRPYSHCGLNTSDGLSKLFTSAEFIQQKYINKRAAVRITYEISRLFSHCEQNPQSLVIQRLICMQRK